VGARPLCLVLVSVHLVAVPPHPRDGGRLLLIEADLVREAEGLVGGPELARLPEVDAECLLPCQ
jgi:hypothetical protein